MAADKQRLEEYRIVETWDSGFYVQRFTTNSWGLFPKWRSVTYWGHYPVPMVHLFDTKTSAKKFIKEHRETGGWPKVVSGFT